MIMENKYISHIKCPKCDMFKLIEDHEIMRVYDQAVMIQFKCYYCGYIQHQIYRRKTK